MASYRLAREAADDLVSIYVTGVRLFGVGQAESYHDGIEQTFAFLAEFPRATRLRTEIEPPPGSIRTSRTSLSTISSTTESLSFASDMDGKTGRISNSPETGPAYRTSR